MTDIPLLSLTIFLPLLGSLVILLIKEDESSVNNIKKVALWASVGVFLLSLLIWFIIILALMAYLFLWLY